MAKKIRLPKMLDMNEMYLAGVSFYKQSYTDEEVANQITALNLIINYFRGRKDCQIIVAQLLQDLSIFESFKASRERD